MKNIRIFLSENFQFLVVKFSVYLNKHVFVMVFLQQNQMANSVDLDGMAMFEPTHLFLHNLQRNIFYLQG